MSCLTSSFWIRLVRVDPSGLTSSDLASTALASSELGPSVEIVIRSVFFLGLNALRRDFLFVDSNSSRTLDLPVPYPASKCDITVPRVRYRLVEVSKIRRVLVSNVA